MKISWRKVGVFLLTCLIGLVLRQFAQRPPIASPPEDRPVEWNSIAHELYGFTLDYPAWLEANTYGESGYRGDREAKLIISRSPLAGTTIEVLWRQRENATLDEVVAWANERREMGEINYQRSGLAPRYQELFLREEDLHGQPIFRRRYRFRESVSEAVYIARDNDMMIIHLGAEDEDLFKTYLPDFERIVQSFRPLRTADPTNNEQSTGVR